MDKLFANWALGSPVTHVLMGANPLVDFAPTWAAFVDNQQYHGVYEPKILMHATKRFRVADMARKFRDRTPNLIYEPFQQMSAIDVIPSVLKIEPHMIIGFRCDGLVEYVYEYHGYRIYGNDARWDISKPGNIPHHAIGVTPRIQAQNHMRRVTTAVPNQ